MDGRKQRRARSAEEFFRQTIAEGFPRRVRNLRRQCLLKELRKLLCALDSDLEWTAREFPLAGSASLSRWGWQRVLFAVLKELKTIGASSDVVRTIASWKEERIWEALKKQENYLLLEQLRERRAAVKEAEDWIRMQ